MSTNSLEERERFVDDWIAKYKPVVNQDNPLPNSDPRKVAENAAKAEENAIMIHRTAMHNVDLNKTNILLFEEGITEIFNELKTKDGEWKNTLATISTIENERFPENKIKSLRNSVESIKKELTTLMQRRDDFKKKLANERAELEQNETALKSAAAKLKEVERIILKLNTPKNANVRPSSSSSSSGAAVSNSSVSNAPLADGWVEYTAEDGRKYYYNNTTKQSVWERPIKAPANNSGSGTLPDGWVEYTAEDGRKYYYNNTTEQSVWKKPTSINSGEQTTTSAEETTAASATAPAEETSAASANTGITYKPAIYFTNDTGIPNIVKWELSDGTTTFTPPDLKEGWKARGYYVRMGVDFNATTKTKKAVVSEMRNSAPTADVVAEGNEYKRYEESDKQEVKYIENNDTIYYQLRDNTTTYTPPRVLPDSPWKVKLYYYLATKPNTTYIFSELPPDAKKTAGGRRRTRRRVKKTRKSRRRYRK
jgi:WW domain